MPGTASFTCRPASQLSAALDEQLVLAAFGLFVRDAQ